MEFKVKKIRENFWCIEQDPARCFLIEGRDCSLLVDSLISGNLRELCTQISPKPIKLVLTHGDFDHVGCMGQFENVYMHPAEFNHYEIKNKKTISALPIWENDIIDLGGYCFEIIHLPGHSPGSIALLEKNKGFLIGGDSVQAGSVYMFGPGRNMSAYKASMKKLIELSCHFNCVFSSHDDLIVESSVIEELYSLADDISRERWPEPEATDKDLPMTIKLYSKGRAHFLLNICYVK